MATSIPIGSKISSTPAVISTGTGINSFSGLMISLGNTVIPDKTVKAYTSAAQVGSDFGTSSSEYSIALVYFSGTGINPIPASTLYISAHVGGTYVDSNYLNTVSQQAPFSIIMTAFPSGLAERKLIAGWVNQNPRYAYASWDNDTDETVTGDTTSFGVWLRQQNMSGTIPTYDATPMGAALVLAWMCSLNYAKTNGRTNLAYRSNAYVNPYVSDQTLAAILESNNYNYYGNFATGSEGWQFYMPGRVSGPFLWADSYVNQIWLNTNLQINLVDLCTNTGNIPFNTEGDTLIASSLQGTIDSALNFGVIRSGVTLSDSEKQAVISLTNNTAAADVVQSQGWYLLPGASTASAITRSSRGPVLPILIYTDGQSVQTINLTAVEVQ